MTPDNRRLLAGVVAALAVYGLLWAGWAQDWGWLTRADDAALDAAHRVGESHSGWVTAWDVFCTVLGPGAFRLAVLVLIVLALLRRRIRLAVFLVVTVELSGLVTEIAKHLAGRARPDTAFVDAWGLSFPSGHALGVLVAVAALLSVAVPAVAPSRRAWLIALGVVIVVTVGVGRVILNVHHPSDVLAGWALGYAYFLVCLRLVPPATLTRRDETPAELDSAR
ncbi:phosphatase PAP2 family protein [Mycolicibacterium sp. PAM1]|uniref:phosphatase PAP2 family protein n=1 Tax=Mycolicibacterium sp. PAM1 TaxID=2853535 RepID=UPI001C3C2BC6|nr:phosphatase PAP2 family protein [Mycolicibacterium sp. PAM1]MBV5246583.1 phosphatase PAP2 family protein [Mycolicibacterium sp. PAM1]